MISERPTEEDLTKAEAGEKRRHLVWAGLVCLFFFALAVAIII